MDLLRIEYRRLTWLSMFIITVSFSPIIVSAAIIFQQPIKTTAVTTPATSSFIAENNYWATSTATTTGPYNATYNPTGTGSAASDYIDFDPWIGKNGTPGPHYVQLNCPSANCGSVRSNQIRLENSSIFASELSQSTSTWNSLTPVSIVAATSTASSDLEIFDGNYSDVVWKGGYSTSTPGVILLNRYYLDTNSFQERQNTITHELGHALGLEHSFTGNVMYFLQSNIVSPGPQDISDYNFLWN